MSYACENCQREINESQCPYCEYDNDYHEDELLIGDDEESG